MISIFVAKLDFGVDSAQLKRLFEEHGKVLKATVATDRETGKPRGFAFVEMENENEAQNAIQALDGLVINGRALAVKKAEDRNDSRPSSPKPNPGNNDRRDFNIPVAPRGDSEDFVAPTIDPIKENRKKPIKDKKPDDNQVDRSKKPKMDAYKKSGKKSQFFSEDDDDEIDGSLFKFDDNVDED